MAKYLIDTCIWRDFYEDRLSKSGRHLGEQASGLFVKILRNNDEIIFSESLIRELKKDYDEKDVNDMLSLLIINKVLTRIEVAKEECLEAKKLSIERNLPFVDCLDAVQARNHGAIIVSQDEHLLKNLSDIAKTVRP